MISETLFQGSLSLHCLTEFVMERPGMHFEHALKEAESEIPAWIGFYILNQFFKLG